MLNLLAQRTENLADAFLVAGRKATTLVFQDICGNRLELQCHLFAGIVEQRQLLGGLTTLLLQRGLQVRNLFAIAGNILLKQGNVSFHSCQPAGLQVELGLSGADAFFKHRHGTG